MISNSPKCKLLWVVDVDEKAGQNLANQYQAKFSKNLNDALTDPKVHCVWISVTTQYHMQIIRETVKHNKHIFVEKPISYNTKEVEEAFKLAKGFFFK